LARVDRALVAAVRAGDPSLVEDVLAEATSAVSHVQVAPDDPWQEPTRLARVWLADLTRIYADRDTSPKAFQEVNRRGSELRRAVESASRTGEAQ
jgi:hypothetical protein